ncbi:MAG TPA: flagellar basal body L-ring protein FlgH [Aliidongia sp.]|nr:flagellar basal body L-ring protein FlgH [Aliidongia sp.]
MNLRTLTSIGIAALSLGACASNTGTKIAELSSEPAMTKISDPTSAPGYQPVSLPVPNSTTLQRQTGSMWQSGARAFFKDQRASRVGDVLTVSIAINDSAILANETQGARNDTDKIGATNFLGLESKLNAVLPSAVSPTNLINTSGVRQTDGKGSINRSEQINVQVAALVTQVLPNGNMVVVCKQEVRVDFDLRELSFTGVVRPTDIDATNTVTWNKIAEARLSYGGRGQSEDLQQPRTGSQLIDILSPF